MKSPKAPKPTAEEVSMAARQSRALDEDTEDMEKRLKAVARGSLGSKSLLAKASTTGSSGAGGASSRGGSSIFGGGLRGATTGSMFRGGGYGGGGATVFAQNTKSKLRNPRSA